jgi:nitronate monooxygenase
MADTHSRSRTPGGSPLPPIIQGGMGVAVSNWRLARAVASYGQLGVISGTGIDTVLVRRLQDGDPGGHLRRVIARFPFPGIAGEVLERYFVPGGRRGPKPYARLPLPKVHGSPLQRGITVLGNFCEVLLAKEGHDGPVGINLLTKIQLPNLPSLYGAMLAGVDYVFMGAGIPREIPAVLQRFVSHEPASIKAEISGGSRDAPVTFDFDPTELGDAGLGPLRRPAFMPIVSSHSLASMLLKKARGVIDGFIVEAPVAGGHNAPPRGGGIDEHGQPLYGERDQVDLAVMRDLGAPFWLAGGMGSPDGLRYALEQGAAGIQVGTAFAYCEESGLTPDIKGAVIAQALAGETSVFTDPRASPTGYPFKIVSLPGSNSEEGPYLERQRVCDLGYLREIYQTPTGTLGFRCASEPVDAYLAKGGELADTVGRKCLCNALMANIGLPQVQRGGAEERPLVTSGDDLDVVRRMLSGGRDSYTARDVIDHLLAGVAE